MRPDVEGPVPSSDRKSKNVRRSDARHAIQHVVVGTRVDVTSLVDVDVA